MKYKSLLLLFVLGRFLLNSQYTHEYSLVNSYDSCEFILNIESELSIQEGEKLLIIQSTGGEINSDNSLSSGNFTDDGFVGNYEVIQVDEVNGTSILLEYPLIRNYDFTQKVQLVKGAFSSTDLRIDTNSPIEVSAWNGSTGGVAFVYAENQLMLYDNIIVDGYGFRGGSYSNSTYDCTWLVVNDDYLYDSQSGLGANKGESFIDFAISGNGGKGRWGNAGGGANDHNSGGAGGASYGSGGNGGDRLTTSPFQCAGRNPGIGGQSVQTVLNSNRLLFGGGGGSGHGNNDEGTAGANGGGIVVVYCESLISTDVEISAKGNSVIQTAGDDGAGGGGGGGVVFIHANSMQGELSIDVSGGNGGDNSGNPDLCSGPGGGGGGGAILTNLTELNNLTINYSGGTKGLNGPCVTDGDNTENGGAGGVVYEMNLTENSEVFPNPVITASDTLICVGESLVLSNPVAVDSVKWQPDILFSDNSLSDQEIFLNEGEIIYMYSFLNGCEIVDSIEVQVEVCTSVDLSTIKQEEELELIDWVYTNSNKAYLSNRVLNYELYDISGKLIRRSNDKIIELNQSRGVYILKVQFVDGTIKSARFNW